VSEFAHQYQDAVPVLRDLFWVGFYDEEADFHCNPYLLVDDQDVVLIDPGSIPHFPIVMRKVIDVVRPEEITWIIAGHQDPDVCGNLPVVEEVVNRRDLKIAAHSASIRFIRHYGIRSEFFPVDENGDALTLASGRVLQFIATPFLHAPGAIATYDVKTRSLFTSDLFGALSQDWSLFAKGDFLEGMAAFHRHYMPSNAVLRNCLERLEKLEIDRILPQHGSILERDDIPRAIEHLKSLPCGNDLR
jgi:flavorubredoxin